MSSSSVYLDDPGDLIAAIPPVLGFTPEQSLVVVVLQESDSLRWTAAIRFDLGAPARAIASATAQICASSDSTLVFAVIVDDRLDVLIPRQAVAGKPPYRSLIRALARRLAEAGIELGGAWATQVIESGRPWWSMRGHADHGLLPDPTSSVLATELTAEGERTFTSRSELVALLEVDQVTADRVGELLPFAQAAARHRAIQSARGADPDAYPRQALKRILRLIADVESGSVPTVLQMVQTAIALRDPQVRESVLGTAIGAQARAAESLWMQLTRSLPAPDRAEAATLLGYSAYVRGDGTLAGLALEAALEADAEHAMAILLETALHLAMPPQSLRRLAHSGIRAAAALGIELDTSPETP
ncbi:DUF4192 domain-containing protein [Nocardia brasiliensis]|uniref:DUF4192 domain-containing protein n=1 Tax=Nocardia brasiliensis TaxID=37326 RepID=UPI0024581A49|nr:DUF4192 domain-containing protein [Nocardia brasiliensis]